MRPLPRLLTGLLSILAFAAPELAQAAGKPGELVIAQGVDAQSLDPAFRVDTATGNVQRHIFDPVLDRAADMSIVPALAEAVERVSPNTFRIRLRSGVSFTNGEPMDAEAVKFTLDRILDPATKAPTKTYFANFEKVAVIDPRTVEVTTKGVDPLFEARMTLLYVVPPKQAREAGATFGQKPVGTGRYRLVEWRKDERVVLAANPTHWSGKATIPSVVFRVVPEELARVAALQTGEADLAVALSPAQAERLKRVQNVRVEQSGSTRVMVLGFDPKTPPGDRLEFRQAVAHAVNRDEIVKGLLKGFGAPVKSIFGPGVPGHPADLDTSFPHDPEKAKQLVQKLGLGNAEIVLRSPSARYPFDRETALAIGAQLKRVGLNVQVRPEEWGVFFEDLKRRRMSPVYLMGHGNVWIDPVPQLEAFFKSDGALSTWADPQLDQMFAKSYQLVGGERSKLFGETLQKLHADAAVVPLYALVYLYGVNQRVAWQPRIDDVLSAAEMTLK